MDVNIKRPFIIAEIGINHNGDLKIAKQLIDVAKSLGCDAVKFQKRDINLVYSKKQLNSYRLSPWGKTFRDQKKGLELNKKEYDEINLYCKKKNIYWFASAWDLKSLKFLKQYDLKFNKIASAMIIDKIFLKEVAKQKKHTFISTGMTKLKDIDEAVYIFNKMNCSYEIMHCVSAYPMEEKDANLMTIEQIKKRYNCKVGYSGHENGVVTSIAALQYNISSLERHLTLDRAMYGTDQSASLEPSGMKFLIEAIDKYLLSIGTPSLGKITKEEKAMSIKLRSHIKKI